MIDRLKKLEAAATPGPWVGDRYDGTVKYAIQGPGDALVCQGCNGNSAGDNPYGFQSTEDESFVMAARNALPALIAVAEAAKGVAGRMHGNTVIAELESALAKLEEQE